MKAIKPGLVLLLGLFTICAYGQIQIPSHYLSVGQNQYVLETTVIGAAKITNDQLIDLFAVNAAEWSPSGPLKFMTNHGDADFTALTFGNTNTRDIAFGDINNDGAVDLATDHYTFLNTGNGYNPNLPHSILNDGYPVKDVALGDFNGDDFDDLLYLVPSPSNTMKLRRSVNGDFLNLTWSKPFDAGLDLAIDFFNTGYLPPKTDRKTKMRISSSVIIPRVKSTYL